MRDDRTTLPPNLGPAGPDTAADLLTGSPEGLMVISPVGWIVRLPILYVHTVVYM